MLRGSAVITRPCNRATRPAVRMVPGIVNATSGVLARRVAPGEPVGPADVGQVMGQATRRALSGAVPPNGRYIRRYQGAREGGSAGLLTSSTSAGIAAHGQLANRWAVWREASRTAHRGARGRPCGAAGPVQPGCVLVAVAAEAALAAREVRREPSRSHRQDAPVLPAYLAGQSLNVRRHLTALRDFRRDEFGQGVARPSEGHIVAVNELLSTLRKPLTRAVGRLEHAATVATARSTPASTRRLLELKSRAHDWVRATEEVWDFYFELFGQRQSVYGEWLVACDRISLDCYQHVYMHLGQARSIPAPPPFSYMRTGFSPATYRRGSHCDGSAVSNPILLVQLPNHRLINPCTMGAIMHEVSHNLQNELDLQESVPRSILNRAACGRRTRGGHAGVGSMEPRDLRGHGRLPAPRRSLRRVVDGRDRPVTRPVTRLQSAQRAPPRRTSGCSCRANCCHGWDSPNGPSSTGAPGVGCVRRPGWSLTVPRTGRSPPPSRSACGRCLPIFVGSLPSSE